MSNEQTQTSPTSATNGENNTRADARGARIVSDPNDVATLVLIQLDAVNDRRDELMIAIKGMSDLTRQLARAYSEHTAAIQALQAKIKQLEEAAKRPL